MHFFTSQHLLLGCALLKLQAYDSLLEGCKEYLQLHQKHATCSKIQSYHPYANMNSSGGNCIFHNKNCTVILYILNMVTLHGEIQYNFSYILSSDI